MLVYIKGKCKLMITLQLPSVVTVSSVVTYNRTMAARALLLATLLCIGYVHSKSLQNLSCKQIRDFVNGHNYRRLQLAKGQVAGQPPASEMKFMIWDDELAAKAAKWAAQNNNYHNPDKTVGSGRFKTGENLYWYSTTDLTHKLNVDNALESWFNEYKDYTYGPLRASDFGSSSGKDIGHYTQMAWSETTHVGCAILETQTNQWKNFYVVCNYGPAGNYIGQEPYKAGRPSGQLVCGNYDCRRPFGDKC